MLEAPYILLAEDNDDDTFFARRCFAAARASLELRNCSDGTQIIRMLEQCGPHRPQAVILDLKMPLMNGFETLEWIRRHPAHKDLPVIILSSSNLPEDVERARVLGATEYLVKPHTLAELEALMKELAGRLAPGSG